jgi:hypothetical protein
MKFSFKLGVALALGLILFRIIVFLTDTEMSEKPIMLMSMLLITAGCSTSIYLFKRKQKHQNALIDDLKIGLVPSMIFTVLVGGFSYFYYNNIDTGYIAKKIQEEEVRWSNKENIQELKQKNPMAYDNQSNEEIKSQQVNTAKTLLSPSFNMSISLLIMSIWSMINGLFVALIFRRVIFRDHSEMLPPKES